MGRRRRPGAKRAPIGAVSVGIAALMALTGIVPPAWGSPEAVVSAPAAAVALPVTGPSPGKYNGLGFDTCTAPSSQAMQAWLASPYRAVGIYFGGGNRGCAQPNLTASWVAAQQAAGWHMIPLYVGYQAPCTTSNKPFKISPPNAAAQGRTSAGDAVAQAQSLGLAAGSVLIFDMEAYTPGDVACRSAVLTFMNAWTVRLHELGYLSGFYSSMASGVADQVAAYNSPGYVHPDVLDFAKWDGVATVVDPAIPSPYWSPHGRMKQYRGDHVETWGGVAMNIDSDYLDFTDALGDFTGDAWPDLLSRETSTGNLYLHRGNGTSLGARITLGSGWNAMSAVIRAGDFNRDGAEDVIARERSTGYLWLYPGTGSGLGSRVRIGTGWNTMTEITVVGDLTGDGYNDLLAVHTLTRSLYLYPGRGTSLGSRVAIGLRGWSSLDELTGVADFNRDGYGDLIARDKATGSLYLYPGRSGGVNSRSLIATGWGGLRDLVGVGDFNHDGFTDLIAIEKSTNDLYLYPGNGSTFGARLRLGTGWGAMQPLL